MAFIFFLCYYYNGDGMDIKIDDIQDNKKVFNWKKLLIIVLSILLCFVLIIIYSRYKATSGLKIYEYKITDSNLPDSFHGIKVVQFSDLYYGNTVDLKYLERIISSINDLKPDVVIFTGDFTDKEIDIDTKNRIIQLLNSINSTIGKYAISGDIDDINLFNDIFSSSGFINLNDKTMDVFYKGDIPITIGNEDKSSDLFNILVLHKPDDFDNYSNKFNLVLAGHSLNGQINIPVLRRLFFRDGSKKYNKSYYDIDGTPFFISNGIGTTNFKFRFNNTPSVSLYRLTKY